jgi:DNA-binding protein HU-beta
MPGALSAAVGFSCSHAKKLCKIAIFALRLWKEAGWRLRILPLQACACEERTLTKADLIDTLAQESELSKRQVGDLVEMLLDEITNALQNGEKVQLIPFGSFVVRQRKRREGRNPKTGEKLVIAARKVPAFSAGKSLRDAVSGTKRKRPRR